ncbi:MAG: TIGR02281 family clan AA aspartic protease [Proteobacteria bacterium]|nr:TIGR02281 family clan AA aspartic protease [Pseudomonadota bacterium]
MTRWLGFLIVAVLAVVLLATQPQGFALDTDGTMRLLYLSLLGGFIGIGFFTGGWRNAGTNLRALLFWLTAIVVIAALYGLRHDLSAAGSRVLAAIVPGYTVATPGELVISRGRGGMFVVDGDINGARLSFLFDTGASNVVLTAADAARAGIIPGPNDYSVPTSTANGIAMAAPVTLATLSVGGFTRTKVPALVAREGALRTSLLGHTFLNRLDSYEVRGDKLILRGN